jgi:hypothetical protein
MEGGLVGHNPEVERGAIAMLMVMFNSLSSAEASTDSMTLPLTWGKVVTVLRGALRWRVFLVSSCLIFIAALRSGGGPRMNAKKHELN